MKKRFKHLEAIAGRNLYKARNSRFHVERGSFPDYSKPPNTENSKPFGKAANGHFITLTSEGKNENSSVLSEWQQWVLKEHGENLKNRVIQVNRLDRHYLETDSREFRLKLENFMTGLINL